MPNIINIVRGATAPVMPRRDVPVHAVFAVKQRDGRLGKNYAAIGHNGRNYSVSMQTGEVASTSNDDRRVQLTGSWAFAVTRRPTYRQVERLRSEVKMGEVFKVRGGTDEYVHLGRIRKDRNGWLSVPLARQQNHAIAENGGTHVVVLADAVMNVTPTR